MRKSRTEQPELAITCSEEQGMLMDTAASFLKNKCTLEEVREWSETDAGYSKELWREMADLGWMGIILPEEYGGAGLGVPELASLMEPMGRYLMASPFLATTLGAQLLLAAGSEEQKKRWLPEIAAGQRVITLAFTEAEGSWEPAHIKAAAERGAGGYRLSGTKCFVLDGPNADLIIGAFKLDGVPRLFLIEPEQASGLSQTREQLVDITRRSSRIDFDGLELPAEALLPGDAAAALGRVFQLAWVVLAAEMAGGAEGAFQLTLEYLQIRKQFGKTIGSFQGLKHPMANIMMDIESTRSLVYHAATVFDGESKQSEVAARMAKAQAGDAYGYAVGRAVQFHGGIGFTWECHAHLFFRRAQWAQYSYGDSLHHRRHLADLLF
jgi:alkylation response protein AidB-like acyl-CoA dehydrogenase